jgi:hypothetical protein
LIIYLIKLDVSNQYITHNEHMLGEINSLKAQFSKTKHLIPEKTFIYIGFNLIFDYLLTFFLLAGLFLIKNQFLAKNIHANSKDPVRWSLKCAGHLFTSEELANHAIELTPRSERRALSWHYKSKTFKRCHGLQV